MADLLQKCSVCLALVDEEDLFCANCGTEAPQHQHAAAGEAEIFRHNFECRGCGASMSYDASAQTLRCPFCGSSRLESKPDAKSLPPARVVPLGVDRLSAEATMRGWLGRGFWRPGDLAERAAITAMTAVYVPYWVFTANTFTYWTADSSQTPFGASGDWVPMSGEHRGSYSGLLVGASSVLTPGETSALCPFDLGRAVPTNEVDLENAIVEQFLVQRKYARPLARQGLEDLERAACTQYVPGKNRNLNVNVRLEGLSSEPVLLPIWVMAYRYQDQVFRFLINGQTGKATGQAPSSWKKIVAAILIAILILLMLLGCLGVGGAIMNADAGDHPHPSAALRPLSVMDKAKLPANAPIREQFVFGKQTSSNQRFVEYLGGRLSASSRRKARSSSLNCSTSSDSGTIHRFTLAPSGISTGLSGAKTPFW